MPPPDFLNSLLGPSRILRGIADRTDIPLAEDCRLVGVVLELEEVSRGVFEEERVMLDTCPREPHAGLLIEGQLFRLGLLQELLPRVFRQERQAEMVGVNASLRRQGFRRQMCHELMPRKPERNGVVRLPAQGTTESLDIETFRRRHIVRGKGQVKEHVFHGFCP